MYISATWIYSHLTLHIHLSVIILSLLRATLHNSLNSTGRSFTTFSTKNNWNASVKGAGSKMSPSSNQIRGLLPVPGSNQNNQEKHWHYHGTRAKNVGYTVKSGTKPNTDQNLPSSHLLSGSVLISSFHIIRKVHIRFVSENKQYIYIHVIQQRCSLAL